VVRSQLLCWENLSVAYRICWTMAFLQLRCLHYNLHFNHYNYFI
jgi:hypothetical protein